MSQLTRAEVNALLKKAAEHRKKISELEAGLRAITDRVAGATPKPDRRKVPRKR